VKLLASKLKSKVKLIKVPFSKFNHIDFVWAKDAYKLVYENVISTLKKHEPRLKKLGSKGTLKNNT
jgi:hypothetical protein